jgi:transcriptional regulator with XRE-family HTH domain
MARRKDNAPFSKILRALMAEKGMKIREAARIAGVSPSTISAWCSGASPESFVGAKALAKALGVSLSFLLTGEEDNNRPSTSAPSITEVFTEGAELFNGYARVVMIQMVPRKPEDENPK